jgi:hypothetical protein
MEIVGMRVPSESTKEYWGTLCNVIHSAAARQIAFVGDFNADPRLDRHIGCTFMCDLIARGWQIPTPDGPWSYISPKGTTSQIDHAVVSPSLRVTKAISVSEIGGIVLAGAESSSISDHAALVIEVETT